MPRPVTTADGFAAALQAAGCVIRWDRGSTTAFCAYHGRGTKARSVWVSFYRDGGFQVAKSGAAGRLTSMIAVRRYLRIPPPPTREP